MKQINRLVLLATIAVVVAALVQQLKRPPAQRDWRGRVAGVPYDFRPPTARRFQQAWWNPEDPRLFTPRDFGVGWCVNLHEVSRRLRQRGPAP